MNRHSKALDRIIVNYRLKVLQLSNIIGERADMHFGFDEDLATLLELVESEGQAREEYIKVRSENVNLYYQLSKELKRSAELADIIAAMRDKYGE